MFGAFGLSTPIVFALLALTSSWTHAAIDQGTQITCAQAVVLSPQREFLRKVRNQYLEASSSHSLALGNEFIHLHNFGSANDHVFSLGSGPDVFRPLYDFPLAGHIHLVDVFTGWGNSEAAVRKEIQARLVALSNLSEPHLMQVSFKEEVWLVQWGNSITGAQKTYVHLNQMNYDDSAQIKTLLARIPRDEALHGIFTSGAPIPKNKSLTLLLDALKPGSAIIASQYRIGRPPKVVDLIPAKAFRRLFSDGHMYLHQLAKSSGYTVNEILNDDSGFRGIFAQYSYIYQKPL